MNGFKAVLNVSFSLGLLLGMHSYAEVAGSGLIIVSSELSILTVESEAFPSLLFISNFSFLTFLLFPCASVSASVISFLTFLLFVLVSLLLGSLCVPVPGVKGASAELATPHP